jgi:hypothetical protein
VTKAEQLGPYTLALTPTYAPGVPRPTLHNPTWWTLLAHGEVEAEGCGTEIRPATREAKRAAIKLLRAEADRLEQED